MEAVIFYLLAAMTIIPAICVVTVRNVFHSALFLVLSLLGVGGIFAMLGADFLFGVQLLVYAGGIMVVLLFVILLSGTPKDWAIPQINEKGLAAGLFSLFFVAVIGTTIFNWSYKIKNVTPEVTTSRLGDLIFSQFLVPLEVVALVMVVALIGAIFFSAKKLS